MSVHNGIPERTPEQHARARAKVEMFSRLSSAQLAAYCDQVLADYITEEVTDDPDLCRGDQPQP